MENPSPVVNESQTDKQAREARRAEQSRQDRRRAQKEKLMPVLRLAGIGLAVVAVIGALIWFGETQDGADQPLPIDGQVSEADHTQGPDNAQLTLIEYADFQCPTCAAYAPVLEQLVAEYPDDLQLVYRYFPLKTIHPNATIASQAAEAAGLQGKFWEMHDILFNRQGEWSRLSSPRRTFIDYAEELGLDATRFESDMNSKGVKDRVDADFQSATAAGLSGTPTFYLNGVALDNPRGYEGFKEVLDAQLAE
jgi:protein-disulfide isomerase